MAKCQLNLANLQFVALVTALAGCSSPPPGTNKPQPAQPTAPKVLIVKPGTNPAAESSIKSGANSSANPFGLKPGMRLVYSVAKEEDKITDGLVHPELSIWLPLGLSRGDVDQNLRWATKSIYDKFAAKGNHPDAVRVWAYKTGSDLQNGENAGMCEFAPHGDYISSGAGIPLDQYKMTVQLNDDYFKPIRRADASVAHIPEKQRHLIAFVLAKADAQADNDAEKQIPTNALFPSGTPAAQFAMQQMKANRDLEEPLDKRYTATICRRYKITPDQADIIQQEATLKSWPVYHDKNH